MRITSNNEGPKNNSLPVPGTVLTAYISLTSFVMSLRSVLSPLGILKEYAFLFLARGSEQGASESVASVS